jgi:drug/metabolite transporter (DMT)-like permease
VLAAGGGDLVDPVVGERLAWYHVGGFAAILAGLMIINRFGPQRLRSEPA